jgi:Fibronectin type III domain
VLPVCLTPILKTLWVASCLAIVHFTAYREKKHLKFVRKVPILRLCHHTAITIDPKTGELAMLPQSLKLCLAGIPLLLCLVWMFPAVAGEIQLTWDTPIYPDGTPVTTLAGYYLDYWQSSAGVRQRVDVGDQTIYTLTGLVNGQTYTFVVTAYYTVGNESSNSNVYTVTIPLSPVLVSSPPQSTLSELMMVGHQD